MTKNEMIKAVSERVDGATVNGSVIGSDDYSISRRMHSKPTQLLKINNNDDNSKFKLT